MIERLPILILFPHSRCNCRCLMCDIWKESERKELSPEDVRRWLPGWRALGVERIVLSGGEALMHGDLWRFCRPLVDAGIRISLLSSGLLLARDADGIARHVDDVILSLDGPRAVHDEIRNVPRAYDRLAEGVAAVRAASRTVGISARCTVQRRNFRHLRETVRAARELGLDRISFLAADVSSEAFNRPGGWDGSQQSAIALAPGEVHELATELTLLEDEFAADRDFIVEGPEKLRAKLLRYFGALAGDGDFAPVTCNAPWVSSVVESDGTVRPCFFHEPLGNIHRDGSLQEILNGEKAVAFRAALDVATNPVCRRCVCSLNHET